MSSCVGFYKSSAASKKLCIIHIAMIALHILYTYQNLNEDEGKAHSFVVYLIVILAFRPKLPNCTMKYIYASARKPHFIISKVSSTLTFAKERLLLEKGYKVSELSYFNCGSVYNLRIRFVSWSAKYYGVEIIYSNLWYKLNGFSNLWCKSNGFNSNRTEI